MSDVTFHGAAGEAAGYLATPGGEGPWPAVVVLHEVFGLTDDIRAWADRFAAEGYLALAPDLFWWGGTVRCILSAFRSLSAGRGRAFDDIDAARAFLLNHDACSGDVGVIGFCMGGGFALLVAGRGFDVAAPNYGVLPRNRNAVLTGACPIVGSYGGRDPTLKGAAKKLEATLAKVGVEHDVKEYPEASHSFLNEHRGWMGATDRITGFRHHEPSADDAWRRIRAFFDGHLNQR